MPNVEFKQFTTPFQPAPPLSPFVRGQGRLELRPISAKPAQHASNENGLYFINQATTEQEYTNAQLDDYQLLSRRNFLWSPPVRLTVTARFSHPSGELTGTAGFGFWNDPFMMTDLRRPTLPRVIWFFYSGPASNMKLDQHAPGWGWKAGTLDARRWPFFALLPTAPVAVPLMNLPWLYRLCWPIGQRAIHVNEAMVDLPMTAWHTYTIEWLTDSAYFAVDGQPVLRCNTPPRGPLGLVIWLDNQAMVVTPWGQFGYQLTRQSEPQWMAIRQLEVQSL